MPAFLPPDAVWLDPSTLKMAIVNASPPLAPEALCTVWPSDPPAAYVLREPDGRVYRVLVDRSTTRVHFEVQMTAGCVA